MDEGTRKTLSGQNGAIALDTFGGEGVSLTSPGDWAVPRDQAGTVEPTVVKNRQRRLEGVEDNVRALEAQGRTTREIQGHLEEF